MCYNTLIIYISGVRNMDIRVGDLLIMKKNHPCGNNEFSVLRSGMDFKLECKKCGHIVMTPRLKAEKNIKKVIRDGETLLK